MINPNNSECIKWYEVYGFLADLLVLFYDKYKDKSGEELYNLLDKDKIFHKEDKDSKDNQNRWFGIFKGTTYIEVEDEKKKNNIKKVKVVDKKADNNKPEIIKKGGWIDPMHLFVSINVNSLKMDLRLQRIDTLIRILRDYLKVEKKEDYNELIEKLNNENLKEGIEKGFYKFLTELKDKDGKAIVSEEDFKTKSYWDLVELIEPVFYYKGCPMTQPSKALKPRPPKEKKDKTFDKYYYERKIWKSFHEIKKNDEKIENGKEFDEKIKKLKDLEELQDVDGIGFILTSIFLFWMDYKFFLPLDKNTVKFLKERRKLEKEPTGFGEDYRKLLLKRDEKTLLAIDESKIIFPFMVNEAWKRPEEQINLNKPKDNEETIKKLLTDYGLQPRVVDNNGFQIIGLKVLKKIEGTNGHLIKALKEDNFYPFYNAYQVDDKAKSNANKNKDDKDKICYKETSNTQIYHIGDKEKGFIPINISAIVGKNGSGKSTLTELLLIAINNLYTTLFDKKRKAKEEDVSSLKYVENLHIQVYIKITYLYRITFGEGKQLEIHRYEEYNGKEYNKPELIYKQDKTGNKTNDKVDNEASLEDLSQFFTLNINYSIYGLKTTDEKKTWLNPVMENGNYIFPIILNPHKENGNIDINREEEELKQRLVLNLLREDKSSSEDNDPKNSSEANNPKSRYSFRQITTKQTAETITFKLKGKPDEVKGEHIKNVDRIHKAIIKVFLNKHDEKRIFKGEPDLAQDSIKDLFKAQGICKYLEHWKNYIQNELRELVKLEHYKTYKKDLDDETRSDDDIERFINRIHNNPNHFTFRIRRAIYFVKFYDKIFDKEKLDGVEFNIADLSTKLNGLIRKKRKHQLQDLIPPSFFDIEIGLTSKSGAEKLPLDRLSSGEKQKIYSISSIFYHIQNIDTINTSSSTMVTEYRNVNIIFDEIELYFHPELQRQYIHDLIEALKKLSLENITGINIIFITHSPFILSDIPSSNILFLEKDDQTGEAEKIKGTQTFAANVHDLLSSGFFMSNTIGEFAASKIRSIVDFHKEVVKYQEGDSEKNKQKLEEDYQNKKAQFRAIYEMIGEEYIKSVMGNHLSDIENILKIKGDEKLFETNADKIRRLDRELKKLKAEVKSNNNSKN